MAGLHGTGNHDAARYIAKRYGSLLLLSLIALATTLLLVPVLSPLSVALAENWAGSITITLSLVIAIPLSVPAAGFIRVGWIRLTHFRHAVWRYPPSGFAYRLLLACMHSSITVSTMNLIGYVN